MDREQEEVVLRCTADYVEALQAGHQPKISDYLARYPQYADAIASFIAYYQAVELPQAQRIESMDNPDSTENTENTDSLNSANEVTSEFHIAIESAWKRVLMPETTPERGNIQSLFHAAKQQQLSPSQLATHLTISEDILLLLEQQALLPESIPQELYRRIAKTLHQPERTVRAYLSPRRRHQVAEHPAIYDTGNAGDTTRSTQKVSFREAIDKSEQLSAAQKKFWLSII